MPDPIIDAINHVFDFVDNSVERIDHAFNRAKRTEEQHQARQAKRTVIDVPVTVKAAKKEGSSSSKFRIVESIASDTGETLFVVTDGKSRAACSTREMAEKLLRALEVSP